VARPSIRNYHGFAAAASTGCRRTPSQEAWTGPDLRSTSHAGPRSAITIVAMRSSPPIVRYCTTATMTAVVAVAVSVPMSVSRIVARSVVSTVTEFI